MLNLFFGFTVLFILRCTPFVWKILGTGSSKAIFSSRWQKEEYGLYQRELLGGGGSYSQSNGKSTFWKTT